jgi:hypothetical protein
MAGAGDPAWAPRTQACSSRGWNIVFSDRGQSMQAIVRVDPGAPKSDALRVLDSIGVAG